MDGKVARPDLQVAEIAERQYGVVSVEQLRRCGVSDDAIRGRAIAGRLHRVHRGVYAVGHAALPPEGRWFAAVLALGRGPHEGGGSVLEYWGAAVSHRSAASLWELVPVAVGPCDVIVDGSSGRARRAGIRVHRAWSLVSADVTLRSGIPVTTPARTIADLRRAISLGLSGAVSGRELRRAIRQANVRGLPIGDEDAADRTRSDLEQAFLLLCGRHRLPRPEVNVRIGPYLVDFLWGKKRLVVETDGYLYHRGKAAFRDDHGRDLELMRLGYEVLRLSEHQVAAEPDRVAEALAAKLDGRRTASPEP
jgi:very-short-patch-repair endonuclease